VPLIEIVSLPEIHSPAEARAYLATLRQLVQYVGVCDGNMEQGSLRCDANVSLRPAGSTRLGTRTEIKNLNSIRNVERALEAEIERQRDVLDSGGRIEHMTLLYDQVAGGVRAMRTKEDEHDYRYFPEPDLPPLVVEEEWVASVRSDLPELPWARRKRLGDAYGLGFYDADVLTQSRALADYYEACVGHLAGGGAVGERAAKASANWIQTDLLRILNERGLEADRSPVSPERLAGLVRVVLDGSISGKIAKDVFEEMVKGPATAAEIVKARGWIQIQDEDAIRAWVVEALDANAEPLARLLAGEEKMSRFFVGQVMKASRGKANPKLVQEILDAEIDARRG
jgi:aspartyl-tRNA(Asn)/glutamyl-tRNA(Gln) amidotransferase subunit B